MPGVKGKDPEECRVCCEHRVARATGRRLAGDRVWVGAVEKKVLRIGVITSEGRLGIGRRAVCRNVLMPDMAVLSSIFIALIAGVYEGLCVRVLVYEDHWGSSTVHH